MLNKGGGDQFSEIFQESIQETVQGIVGESSGRALLFHLNFPESADSPAEFASNLRVILLAGSPVVENAILKQLWNKMGLFLVHADESGSFEARVARARALYSERQRSRQVIAR